MKKILLLCFVLPILSSLKAQLVNVNIAITPPYSSRISDYANNPGKIILTLTTANSGPVVAEPRVLLKVTIKGDNGIILSTKNNYIPSQPIIVQSNAPKVVDIQTISELFDINSLSIQGITEKEITEKGGLPEGNYQFCVRAFLYDNPNIPASAESPAGCTYVRLTELDPPLLIKPFDKEEIVQMGVQNLIFSWSISPGAEPGTQYLFRMIEMLDPSKNPNDAMNARTTPAFFETITYSNILLYGPSEPTLVAGRKYAWSVTALPGVRGTAYKNNGRSEVRSFTYKLPSTTFNTFAKLSFIIPNKKLTEYKISNSKPLLLSWNWFDDNAKQDTVQVNDTAYKKYGATKYIITIKGISKPSNNQQTDKNFNKSYTITINNNTLSSKLQLTQKEILDAGMKLNYWYNATVESFDVNNNSIAKEQSVDFKLTNAIEETPSLITNIKGTIKYDYYGKPNLYNASNTPIEVRALRPFSSDAIEFPQIVLGNVSYNIIATQVTNTKKDGSFETNIKIPKNLSDKDLVFQIKSLNAYYYSDSFPTIKQKLTKDSTFIIFGQLVAKTFAYTLNVEVEKFYPAYSIKQDADGNLSIALDTSKQQFDYVYDKEKGMIYKSSIQKPEAGINMLLFRKNKNNYVPPIEGQLTESSNTTGFVIVAQGVTTIEKKNGKDIALVKFNNLLSNIYQGDEYFLVAVNAKNIKEGNTSGKIIVDGKEVPLKSLAINNEENFAEEKMIQIVLPPKGLIAKNFTSMLYRTINTVYNITSKKPPTSLVKGRIMYQWHGDKKGILRPYANQKFKIVVDYLADGSSVASTIVSSDKNSTTVTERFFVPEKGNPTSDGMQLSDYGKTMAIGKTDAQGNFELEVINLNPKGSIGKGKIVEKSWTATDPGFKNTKDPGLDIGGGKGIKQQVSNPGDNFSQIMHGSNWMGNNQMPGGSSSLNLTNLMNKTSQGFMNSGNGNKGFSYNTNTGFTEISGAADIGNKSGGFKGGAFGGPNINEEEFLSTNQQNNLSNTVFDKTLTDEIEVQNFERVFRIAPDNMFLSPSVQSFIVQPFQASNTGNFTSKVKETTKIVTAKENKTLLSGMKVTVFRRLEDKSSILPIGEGDGLYTQKKLINPEYNSESGVYYGANLQKLDKQNIYNTTFEQLWSGVVTDKDGKVELPLLLQGYNYYIQVCSDPTQGTNFYQSYFTTTGNSSNIIANMQPITSRVFVRVLDNATQKAIPYAKVSTGFSSTITDENGYTEIKVNDPILNTIIKKDNDAVTLYASSTGYNSESRKITFAKLKGFQQSIILSLNPGKTLTGRIISKDENNKAVQAYIKTKEGAIVETDANGNFKIAALNKENLQLQVIPKDVAYFDTTIIVPKSATALNNIGVYRKKHRIRFTIQDADDKKAINACTIQLGDNTVKTNAFGFADFIFENVSINNYTCIIRGPQGDNYIPISVNIKNEESTTYQYYNIKLEKGSEISGTVKLDGQPIKNAKVYIEYNNQSFYYGSNNGLSNDVNLNTAFTNSQGLFSLKGIPVNNKQINIIAVLDTNFTVNGDNQTINIVHKKATANLNLSRYDNMLITHIMGFPLTVEKLKKAQKQMK
ncbi:MAG: hypothetical protein LC122_02960 [Chitinophagales bacterium]|nr:hypothetical protein [Chitinophagales bacterium]